MAATEIGKVHNAFVQHRTELVLPAGLTDIEAEHIIDYCTTYLKKVMQGFEYIVGEHVVVKGTVDFLPYIDAETPGVEGFPGTACRVYIRDIFA